MKKGIRQIRHCRFCEEQVGEYFYNGIFHGYMKTCKSHKNLAKRKENSTHWKDENIGYSAVHKWVKLNLGSAIKCSFNNTHKVGRYHWANISGLYLRDLLDWIQLCPSCHKEYDTVMEKRASNIFAIENGQFTSKKLGVVQH